MPNPNAMVGLVTRIDPPAEKMRGTEFFRRYPDGATITVEGERRARLAAGERSAAQLEILEELRQMGAPVYLEVQPENGIITRLLIPLVATVTNITEGPPGDVMVDLLTSHARHFLRRNNPEFEDLLKMLRVAREKDAWQIVTETEANEIIDVRPSPRAPFVPQPGPPTTPKKKRGWFSRFCCCFCWFCCISGKRAQELFDMCASKTCDPTTVPPPCIPFLFPDDGCWARAHEMCRLMMLAGAKPRKVWIDGSLHVNTRNNPFCHVDWGWHVAPTLCVRRRFCCVETMVIDPSLFTTPVTEAGWKGVQGDPNATLTETDATVYWRNVIPTDPNYVDTNFQLQKYRLKLKNRSLQFGPPPYANCP